MIQILRRGIKQKELAIATRHLGLMVKSGVALTRALEILANQASPRFQAVLATLVEKVREGVPFSEALAQTGSFSTLYVAMVRSAEAAGNLEEVLMRLAEQLEREVELKNRVRNALMYPAVIVTAMVGIGILMMILVVPRLAETFEGLGVELPASTKVIIAVSTALSRWWFLLPIGIGGAVFGLRRVGQSAAGGRLLSWLMLHAPVMKALVQKMQIARFSRTLSSLMAGGVAVLEALSITQETLGNAFYKGSLTTIRDRIEKGEGLAKAMAGFERIYPPVVQQMITVGEETGALADILKHLAEFYESEVSEFTKSLSTLIEPVLMVVIGAGVGFFAISMIQPMYGLLNAL